MSDTTRGRAVSLADQFNRDIIRMEPQFVAALPPHIPVERFMRACRTAWQNSSNLKACSFTSFWNACVRAAQDGLVPDGREGAIVPFGTDEDGRAKPDTATWMPMIQGIRKLARNSGEIEDWDAHIVYEGDEFDYQLGDSPHIHHKPALTGGRTRKITHAYSVAHLKGGMISRMVMNIDEVEDIRKRYSRSRKGPWNDPIAYPEMVRKTVLRKHAKALPMSTDLDMVLRRDDVFYDVNQPPPTEARAPKRRGRPPTRAALDHFASGGDGGPETITEDGEIIDNGPPPADTAEKVNPVPKKREPKTVDEYRELVELRCNMATEGGVLRAWFVGDEQRKLRNTIGLVADETGELRDLVERRVAELGV